jgi:DegV family protein with EDD domain
MKIVLVSDSTADIPAQVQEQYGIEVVPAIINVNGRSYEDGLGITREEFYTHLPDMVPPPTTSAPSVGAFQSRYEKLLQRGAAFVISIHPANTLSGIFNAARLAAQGFGERVRVIDSGQLSLGTGFQVLAGAEAVEGGANLEEVLANVESVRQRVRVIALLESVEYVRRSGRVSWAIAIIGSLLHIQPMFEVRHGIVHRLGQARTRRQGITRMKEILNNISPLGRLAVLHTNAENTARILQEEVKSLVRVKPFLVNVTTTIGTHVGPNGLGFAVVPIEQK